MPGPDGSPLPAIACNDLKTANTYRNYYTDTYVHAVAGVVREVQVGAILCRIHIPRRGPAKYIIKKYICTI